MVVVREENGSSKIHGKVFKILESLMKDEVKTLDKLARAFEKW